MEPWVVVAKSYIGLKEIKGKIHNPTIVEWLRQFALNIGRWGRNRDETPWCAVFVSHCLEAVGMKSTRDARAVSYAQFGEASAFKEGAILVIQRKKKKGKNVTGSNRGGYHVLFCDKVTKHWIWGWGGNQKNRVSRQAYARANYRIVACRWPTEKLAA